MDASTGRVSLRDVVIVGGGCYGTFYAEQLKRAAERGKAEYRRVLIVDRNRRCKAAQQVGTDSTCRLVVQDWSDFFDEFLEEVEPSSPDRPDAIVPPR